MKKITALLTLFILLFTLTFTGSAEDPIEPTLHLEVPTKIFYQVGESPDYTGGVGVYTAQTDYRFPLSEENCSGFDSTEPGNKTVTVTIQDLTDYFTLVVLSNDEPITAMKDISPKHWSYTYFGPCMKAGYFTGDDTSNINPNNPITRAEMAQIIYRAWQKDPRAMNEIDDPASPFKDVSKKSWYYTAVDTCRKAGILQGMENGKFMPDQPISRQDAVLMLMRISYTNEELTAVDTKSTVAASGIKVTDFDQVSDYAAGAMALALGKIINGDDQNAINPQKSITRAECAAIFQRLFLKEYEWHPPVVEIPNEDPPKKEPAKDDPSVKKRLVYLSPSRQFSNSYAAGNTTEGEQMYLLAEATKKKLVKAGFDVFIADKDLSIYDRPEEANKMNADLYITLHTNSGGGNGTRVYYNGDIKGCKKFSKYIFNELASLTNTPYNTNFHKEDYLCLLKNGTPFYEVAHPTMPLAYVEAEFHDNKSGAKWIVKNINPMATAITKGVVEYCKTLK